MASGARTDCKQLARALRALKAGDVLTFTPLDRLACFTRDLLNTLEVIAQGGAGFRSLHDTWADITTPHGRLMLTVFGGLAARHQRMPALEAFSTGAATQADLARRFNGHRATIFHLLGDADLRTSSSTKLALGRTRKVVLSVKR